MASLEAPLRTRVMAGAGFVCISTSIGLLYKTSQAASGGFKYSTTSAITIAEAIKFCLSVSFHIFDEKHHVEGMRHVTTALRSARSQLSMSAAVQITLLAGLYALNNQLSFFLYMFADPGTIYLFKAGSTLIVAATQWIFVGKAFTQEQWRAMVMQGCGMVVVQYNPCTGGGRYRWEVYMGLAVSTAITAVSTVRNEFLVKNYKIDLHVQNAVLYFAGAALNLIAFLTVPNPNDSQAALGFFDGYSNPPALAVVASNAVIGLAITAVYKYADAITKCIASDITAVLLCILSSWFFGVDASITTWCGVATVVFAVHSYIEAGRRAAVAPSVDKKVDAKADHIKYAAQLHRRSCSVSAASAPVQIVGSSKVEQKAPVPDQSSGLPLLRSRNVLVGLVAAVVCSLSGLFSCYPSYRLPAASSTRLHCVEQLLLDDVLGGESLEAAALECLRRADGGVAARVDVGRELRGVGR